MSRATSDGVVGAAFFAAPTAVVSAQVRNGGVNDPASRPGV